MLKTDRLLLRPWRSTDFEPFAHLNADPRVMKYFPKVLSREESDLLAQRLSKMIETQGWGLWAVSVLDGADFIGFIGLNRVDFQAPFTPAVEIGWRLAYDFWGKGYATEGALAAVHYAFEILKLSEIVSFTPPQNLRSRKVMERIGMKHDPKDDFDHPKLPQGHPLQRHVLYRLKNPAKN